MKEVILKEVSTFLNTEESAIMAHNPGARATTARLVFVSIYFQMTTLTKREIARRVNRTEWALNKMISKADQMVGDDKGFKYVYLTCLDNVKKAIA